ncbi:MAG: hypothetical protein NTX27_20790, partial [Verrucomicrobia bacterium]|nr:hypothetical protein [Verrucomicrobiota bacterium]
MEKSVLTRYVFMTLIAVADPKGHVIGTDIALARRVNITLKDFKTAISELMEPDADSNSPDEEGRRVVLSECGRGYRLVNYTTYRDTRDEDHRREYMRNLMAQKRAEKPKDVSNVSSLLANVSSPLANVSSLLAPVSTLANVSLSRGRGRGRGRSTLKGQAPLHPGIA